MSMYDSLYDEFSESFYADLYDFLDVNYRADIEDFGIIYVLDNYRAAIEDYAVEDFEGTFGSRIAEDYGDIPYDVVSDGAVFQKIIEDFS